jgi:hypothetical protein
LPYDPIPDDQLESTERLILPAVIVPGDPDATAKVLSRLTDIGAFAFLLTPDLNHPLATVVRQRWSEIHHRSGDHFALVAFAPPAEWAEAIVDQWRVKLGDQFDAIWARWQKGYGLEAGAAYDYIDRFKTQPPLRPDDLPCIVIFCDPNDNRAIVRAVPNWPAADLFGFLCGIIDTVTEHLSDPIDRRLDELAKALTSPGARFRTVLGHYAGKAFDYCKAHPAKVVGVALSGVLAFNPVLALSAAGVQVVTNLDNIVKGSSS